FPEIGEAVFDLMDEALLVVRKGIAAAAVTPNGFHLQLAELRVGQFDLKISECGRRVRDDPRQQQRRLFPVADASHSLIPLKIFWCDLVSGDCAPDAPLTAWLLRARSGKTNQPADYGERRDIEHDLYSGRLCRIADKRAQNLAENAVVRQQERGVPH